MPNIRHTTRQAGVSITTFSRALNNLAGVSEAARQAVLATVNRAGYALSLVGFDDAELRHILVAQLTAVCQNTKALGREGVAMLGQMITQRGARRPMTQTLRCGLELHEIPAPCPSASAARWRTQRRAVRRS
jgi:DNA-binding LacI/PurR family transcriptional regulator